MCGVIQTESYYLCNVISIACWYRYKDILISFLLLEIMIIESICLKVKELDLYIIDTTFKFIKITLILLFKYKEFYFIEHKLLICINLLFSFKFAIVITL